MTILRSRFGSFVIVQAPYGLIKGESVRSTTGLNLSQVIGGTLLLAVGFGGSTDLTNGVDVRVNYFDGSTEPHPGNLAGMRTSIDPGICLINNNPGPYAAGAVSIAFDGGLGRAFVANDYLCFWGVGTIPTSSGALSPTYGTEFLRMGKGATTPFLLERGTKYQHGDNEYIGLAECWTIHLGPGKYEVIFDYLDDAAGEAVCCYAGIWTYDIEQATV